MRALAVTLVTMGVVASCGDAATDETTIPTEAPTTTVTTAAPATTTASTAAPTTTAAPSSAVSDFIAAYGEVGDCLLFSYTEAGDDFDYDVAPEIVDCAEPHDQQVFFVGELPGPPGDPYPGFDAVFDLVFFDLCEGPFQDTFGIPSDSALSLEFWGTWPFAEEWEAGLRTFKCSVAAPGNSFGDSALVGDASSAGLVLPGHLLATVAEFDMLDMFIWIFGEQGEILDTVNLTFDDTELREASSPPSWSPDLSLITYTAESADGNAEVFVVDVASGDKTNISNNPGGDFGPAFSPDGTRIAFASDRNGAESNIFVMDVDGSNVTQLTFHDDRESSADWSPDGERIVFRRRTGGNSDIWTMNADGSDQAFLVGGPGGEFDPDWSPDGSVIAFISDEGGDFDIWTFPAEGITTIGAPPSLEAALATRITDHPGNDEYPQWTPDGEFILFQSDRHGVQDVWMMRADGSDQTALLFTYPVGFPQAALPAG